MAKLWTLKRPTAPRVYVCTGSDCRKRSKDIRKVTQDLTGVEICAVKCQKLCSGPVIGVEMGGKLEWFSKVKRSKTRRQLVHLIRTGELKGHLKSRLQKKRSGKLRGALRSKRSSKAA